MGGERQNDPAATETDFPQLRFRFETGQLAAGAAMPFLDREHFSPHFFSEKRQGTVTGAVATLLGTLLGMEIGPQEMLVLNQQQREHTSPNYFVENTEFACPIAMRATS